MFKEFREQILNFILSRTFILMLIIYILFGVLVHRLFVLQIVNGESYQDNFTLKILKEQSIKSTRGKIYDSKGKLLAYDELAYSVTIEDNYDTTGSDKNRELNATINSLVDIVEDNNDKISCEFNIILNKNGKYEYAIEGKALLRFLADIYGYSQTSDMKLKEKESTPDQVMEYLCSSKKFGIGTYTLKDNGKYDFVPMEGFSPERLLKIVSIRYAMSLNGYQKYIATTVATGLSERTVAVVMENKTELQGVDIYEDTIRKYINEPSLSPILGYTGIISQAELESLNADGGDYERNDMVGRAGIEQEMERYLQGKKGYRQVYVDNVGKIVDIASQTEPVAGNDLYLTIDSELQSAIYDILEQKLAGIVVSHIRNQKEYVQGEHESAANIIIPIDDVYYALFNNGVIDISHLSQEGALTYEQRINEAYNAKMEVVLNNLSNELFNLNTPYDQLDKEYQVYESFITSMISNTNAGIMQNVDEQDEVYLAWKAETISLSEYLKYAIAMEWIDVTNLDTQSQYSDSQQVYEALVAKIMELLKDNNNFGRKILKYMIRDDNISGLEICMVLYEQGVISENLELKKELLSGEMTPYSFMINLIRNLQITPAQLALDPCTASCVITDVNTGEVRACVSYPCYDNNRMANSIDPEYYNKLRNDLSNPLYSYATQQKTAPGSTYKIVSSIAGLNEGVINLGERIDCLGQYDKADNPKCWKFPSNHGELDVAGAITNSCNFFFYEVGYRLGCKDSGRYDSNDGLNKLAKYADEFGLSEASGIELSEAEPTLSTEDAVRSAIGQGTNAFTTVGLARYITSVANSGTTYQISILDRIEDPSGQVIEDFSPEVRNYVQASDAVWNNVHRGMRGVVMDSAAFKESGIDAAGKTGTAQQVRTRPNHALFVGYAPFYTPEISIATRIAYGYTSANAAEAARDVFQYYFGVKDKDDIITGQASIPTSGTISD